MAAPRSLTHALLRALRPASLRPLDVPVWLGGMVVACLWAAPFVWMVSTSFKPPGQVMTRTIEWFPRTIVLDNYKTVLRYPIATWTLNSIVVTTVSTALSVLVGAMAGYALARLNFPGRRALFAVFVASMMIPTEIAVVPMLIGFIQIGWASTYQALILPPIGNVLSVYIFRQFFLQFPAELEDAAIVDGATRATIFWRIAFPLARSATIAATVILFTLNWNTFLWPLLVTFDEDMKTLPVGIAAFAPSIGTHTQLEGYGPAMAAITILSVPSLLLFLLLQRYFIQGIRGGGLTG